MTKKDVQEWLDQAKDFGYIDCGYGDGEYEFIFEMAEELLKRM